VLVAVGLGLLAVQFYGDIAASAIVLLIGLAFLVGYWFLDSYGLLIPGAIMTGLGVGVVFTENFSAPESVGLLGLGIGFLSIYLIDRIRSRKNRWWPLIPGGIVTVIGVGSSVASMRDIVATYWPVVLVFIGVLIIWKGLRERQPSDSGPQTPVQ
jgi:hypothetical protein